MSDRVAIVTGAGGPLGRATAVKLAAAGFTVVGIDRNENGLRELPNGIRQVPGDTTDPAVPKERVGDCEHQTGGAELFDGQRVGAAPSLSGRDDDFYSVGVEGDVVGDGRDPLVRRAICPDGVG